MMLAKTNWFSIEKWLVFRIKWQFQKYSKIIEKCLCSLIFNTKSQFKIYWFSKEKCVLIFNRKMMLVKINWFSIEKFVPVFNTKNESQIYSKSNRKISLIYDLHFHLKIKRNLSIKNKKKFLRVIFSFLTKIIWMRFRQTEWDGR